MRLFSIIATALMLCTIISAEETAPPSLSDIEHAIETNPGIANAREELREKFSQLIFQSTQLECDRSGDSLIEDLREHLALYYTSTDPNIINSLLEYEITATQKLLAMPPPSGAEWRERENLIEKIAEAVNVDCKAIKIGLEDWLLTADFRPISERKESTPLPTIWVDPQRDSKFIGFSPDDFLSDVRFNYYKPRWGKFTNERLVANMLIEWSFKRRTYWNEYRFHNFFSTRNLIIDSKMLAQIDTSPTPKEKIDKAIKDRIKEGFEQISPEAITLSNISIVFDTVLSEFSIMSLRAP